MSDCQRRRRISLQARVNRWFLLPSPLICHSEVSAANAAAELAATAPHSPFRPPSLGAGLTQSTTAAMGDVYMAKLAEQALAPSCAIAPFVAALRG